MSAGPECKTPGPAVLLKGTDIAKEIREQIQKEVAESEARTGVVPGIVTILVGVNPASRSYVRSKDNTARDLGFKLCQEALPADVTDEQIIALIDQYNRDPTIHGVVIQMPLPKHLNEAKVLMAIDPNKDVDGFHPVNYGKLLSGRPSFLPCTAYSIQELLLRSGKPITGAEIVGVGRSNIAGKPIAAMLMQNATGKCHRCGRKDGQWQAHLDWRRQLRRTMFRSHW